MNAFSLRLAERVILAADREHPADSVLRDVLKAERDLTPDQRSTISAAVFAYFRWRGWAEPQKTRWAQIELAASVAERYAAQPQTFTNEELVVRAVPA